MVCAFWKIVLIFLYSVCLLVSSEDNTKKKCKLPPSSWLFGVYYTNKRASPGDEVDSVLLYYLCSDFGISGTPGVLCSNGIWSHNPPHRECLPYCDMENDTKVVNCALGRCIPEPYPRPRPFMPPVGVDVGLTFRNKDQDDCGKPRVEVVFGSKGTLEPVLVTSWHASIYTKTTKPYTRTCGGSLVTKSIVISAAHCFWGDDEQLPVENYAVAVGKRHFKWDGPRELYQTSNVREVKIPPGFRGAETNFQDDIALVIVTLPFIFTPDVQPVCLNFDHELEKTQLVHENIGHVPGWDVPTDGEENHLWLKAADLPFLDKEKCIEESPAEFVPSITADKMCVGHKNSTVLCANDSGSGLVFLGGGAESRFYLRGVMTTPSDYHGNNTCHANVWATATKISSHELFITDNMPDIFN